MPFNFEYAVNDAETANDYNHNAVSDGDVTRGEYRVQLPDGRTQIVKYTADWKNGYNAEVGLKHYDIFVCIYMYIIYGNSGILPREYGGIYPVQPLSNRTFFSLNV